MSRQKEIGQRLFLMGVSVFFLLTRVFFLINVQNASCTCELFSVRQLQSAGQENPVAAMQPELRTQD